MSSDTRPNLFYLIKIFRISTGVYIVCHDENLEAVFYSIPRTDKNNTDKNNYGFTFFIYHCGGPERSTDLVSQINRAWDMYIHDFNGFHELVDYYHRQSWAQASLYRVMKKLQNDPSTVEVIYRETGWVVPKLPELTRWLRELCPRCGSKISSTHNYCGRCGKRLKDEVKNDK